MLITEIPIFIVHHNKLIQRKQNMLVQLNAFNLTPVWVEDFLPETLSIDPSEKLINKNEYSLFLKFEKALIEGIKTENSYFLILEDDVVLPKDFNIFFPIFFNEFKNINGDLLMVGDCCGLGTPNPVPGRYVYWEPGFTTRCGHAILYTKSAAERILPKLTSPLKGYDHKLNDIIKELNLKSCYLHPGIEQLTQSADPLVREKYKSSVQPN